MSIPKLVFTFWEGKQFTYMHYLTALTFRKYNPELKFIVYISSNENSKLITWNSHEHRQTYTNLIDINKLYEIDNIEIVYIDVNKEINYNGYLSAVWKSDIIRILKLYEHGGIYIDFDILFIKKIPDYLFDINQEMAFNTYEGVINNAFIVSKKKSNICKYILNNIYVKLYNINNEYQQFGPSLITSLIKNTVHENKIYYIPNEETCPYIWNQMNVLFKTNNDLTTNNTFCIHWYNGSPESREYCNNFNINKIDKSKNVFEKLLYGVLN